MEKQQIVKINPEGELKFMYTRDQSLKAYLTIENISAGSIAYKVKTTAPRFYVVKPNQGIIDQDGRMNIDISLISGAENNIAENKFMVQAARCQLQSSETYALNTFWESQVKKEEVTSFKLKVSISDSQTGQQPIHSNQESETQHPNFQGSHQQQRVGQKFEKAPEQIFKAKKYSDNINQSETQLGPRDQFNEKFDELNRKFKKTLEDKKHIEKEIQEIKNAQIANDGKVQGSSHYNWQEGETKPSFKFQLIHLVITAILCLLVGGYLGGNRSEQPEAVLD